MGMQLVWHIEGERQISRLFQKIEGKIQDFTPAFEQTARFLIDKFSGEVFATAGQTIGMPWKPLSRRYLAQKVAAGYPPDILIRTGKMRKAFQSVVKPMSATVYNSAPYFPFHQSNAPRSGKLPRRTMMHLPEKYVGFIRVFFGNYWHNVVHSR